MDRREPPLIVTCELDDAAFARFEALRREHFPPERNLVPAHVTLFHALPGAEREQIAATLSALCSARGPLDLRVDGLRSLGGGVAYTIDAPELAALRSRIASRWAAQLTRQDAQPFRPHVVVQNKAAPARAKALLAQLRAGFTPFVASGTGLLLWHYLGGPWRAADRFPFTGPA